LKPEIMKFYHFVVLSLVGQINGRRGRELIVGLLRGAKSRKVDYLIRKNDLLGFYNLFSLLTRSDVRGMFLELLTDELIEIREERVSDGFTYSLIYITSKGGKYLAENARCFKVRLDELLTENKHLMEFQTSLVEKTRKERSGSYSIDEMRDRYPRAYEKWVKEEDENLRNEFKKGRSVIELAEVFGRKPGAIRSRLIKNRLITEVRTTENI